MKRGEVITILAVVGVTIGLALWVTLSDVHQRDIHCHTLLTVAPSARDSLDVMRDPHCWRHLP